MSITCKFELSRVSNIYYSGEEVAGSVTIASLKQRYIEAITLEFYGETAVRWWETDKSDENLLHNDFSSHEVLSKTVKERQQKHVWEQTKLQSFNCKLLQPHVEYTCSFLFAIPAQAPATYRCRYGQTAYGLQLRVQCTKSANKEFHHRLVVKNTLDLSKAVSYKEPCCIYRLNAFGQFHLQLPCTGFTPGQQIPYCLLYQSARNDCKMLIQLNCYTSCRIANNSATLKRFKETVGYKMHLSSAVSSWVNVPLHSRISSTNGTELVLSCQYTLEAFLMNGQKKVMLSASIPLAIGTTPCCTFHGEFGTALCFDNPALASPPNDLCTRQKYYSLADQEFEPLWMLFSKQETNLKKPFKYCKNKLKKILLFRKYFEQDLLLYNGTNSLPKLC